MKKYVIRLELMKRKGTAGVSPGRLLCVTGVDEV